MGYQWKSLDHFDIDPFVQGMMRGIVLAHLVSAPLGIILGAWIGKLWLSAIFVVTLILAVHGFRFLAERAGDV